MLSCERAVGLCHCETLHSYVKASLGMDSLSLSLLLGRELVNSHVGRCPPRSISSSHWIRSCSLQAGPGANPSENVASPQRQQFSTLHTRLFISVTTGFRLLSRPHCQAGGSFLNIWIISEYRCSTTNNSACADCTSCVRVINQSRKAVKFSGERTNSLPHLGRSAIPILQCWHWNLGGKRLKVGQR